MLFALRSFQIQKPRAGSRPDSISKQFAMEFYLFALRPTFKVQSKQLGRTNRRPGVPQRTQSDQTELET